MAVAIGEGRVAAVSVALLPHSEPIAKEDSHISDSLNRPHHLSDHIGDI